MKYIDKGNLPPQPIETVTVKVVKHPEKQEIGKRMGRVGGMIHQNMGQYGQK